MAWPTFSLPDGWPVSLWFFIATAIVFLLQLFPYTGIFLMLFMAAFWSVLLINLGMAGIVVEVITGRVNLLWLIIPLVYIGGYYLAYTYDQRMLAGVIRETIRFNDGQSLPIDLARQDLLVAGDQHGGTGVRAADFVERFGLPQVFDRFDKVSMVGTKESCALIQEKSQLFLSAGILSLPISSPGKRQWQSVATGFCLIQMHGTADKQLIRVTEKESNRKVGRLTVKTWDYTARDEVSGATARVRIGRAQPLKRMPMPIMGCFLNSGQAKWQCEAGFLRDTEQLLPHMARYEGAAPTIAKMLGLTETADLSKHAVGVERFKPLAEKAEAEITAKEVAVLEQIIADPLTPIKNSYFSHLPKKSEVIAPYAARIVATLQRLQSADHRGSAHGRDLWVLMAAMPEDVFEPHRAAIVAMMQPGSIKDWTQEEGRIWSRLDAARPDERALLLGRIDTRYYSSDLVRSFCRIGAAVPEDAKRRLLARWHDLGRTMGREERPIEHIPFYLALARMGLKAEAGKVEQRYIGSDWRGIWAEVTPETPDDICDLNEHELSQRFRNYRD